MRSHRKKLVFLFISVSLAFILFPSVSFAVDYTITDVKIEAYLQENGEVFVEESHTYSFDGAFNGITREIVPKDGSKIVELEATEQGNALPIEREEDLYKIHRQGNGETIIVLISYTILNGVNVYSDAAEFYWPFFDQRNASSYQEMTITIHPPKPTNQVIAFGYDTAFATEEIQSDGSVLYRLGYVPAETNGDIRVAYPPALFPSANITADKPMLEEIKSAGQ